MSSRPHLTRVRCEMFSVVALLLCNFLVVSHSQECSRRLVERDGSSTCYNLVFADDTWSVAGRQCASRGPSSRLAIVTSPEQNAAITELLRDNGLSESWLAASEHVHAWQWLDGSDVSYQGCYKDEVQSRDLTHHIPLPAVNSPQRCLNECAALSFPYAGLQNGDECWCGDSFGRHGQRHTTCGITCPGQDTATCGGNQALDIYAVAGSYSNWTRGEPYNPSGNVNCAVMDASQDEVHWMPLACSESHVGALCDLGPATSSECRSPSSFIVAGRCVDVITDVNTYFEARALCRWRGPDADLVQLKTDTDNAQAAAALRTYLNSTQLQMPNAFWIGLVRSRWSWEAGVEMLFTNWDENTPTAPTSATQQQCAILSRDVSGRWKNVACSLTKPFVCEDVNRTLSVRTTVRTTTTTKITTTTTTSGRTMSSLMLNSAGSTTSFQPPFQSSTAGATGASNMPFSTGVMIAIACGGFVFLLGVVIFAVVIPVVLCRRKHGGCCCGESAAEAGCKDDETPDSPTDLKPHYYFGVTVDDLRQADDEPTTSCDNITTPPPDVVPAPASFTDHQQSSGF